MSDFFSQLLTIVIAAIIPTLTTDILFTIQRKLRVKYKTAEYSSLVTPLDRTAFKFTQMNLKFRIFIGIFIGLVIYKLVFVIVDMLQ